MLSSLTKYDFGYILGDFFTQNHQVTLKSQSVFSSLFFNCVKRHYLHICHHYLPCLWSLDRISAVFDLLSQTERSPTERVENCGKECVFSKKSE
jgi:hypothetical protein